MPNRLFCVLLVALAAWIVPARPASADDSERLVTGAVIFIYHRFGEDQSPANSIRVDQFEAHLEELTAGDYDVVPLSRIVAALRAGTPLPDRTVAITIDDATRSVYTQAFPRLRAAGLPFTLFVATDPVDRRAPTHMTWAEIREVQAAGATIGAMTSAPVPMPERDVNENAADLHHAMARFRAELGSVPALFAYPHGEYNRVIRNLIEKHDFVAAFGQHSGVAHARADRYALPRFIMNESFGGIDRFRLAASALPLPVREVTPDDPELKVNPPHLGFTVPEGIGNLERLACFASGHGRTALEHLDGGRIEVRINAPLPPGRARINCTLPAGEGRWRWFGMQLFVPDDENDDP